MKSMFKNAMLVLIFMTLPSLAVAEDAEAKKESDTVTKKEGGTVRAQTITKKLLNPWVDCGIGAMIFSDTGWAAVTSNIIWDLGSTATTSDQSSQHTCNSAKAQMAMYVGVSYANLEEQTAIGEGPHVSAMLSMMGCNSASHKDIMQTIRRDFSSSLRDVNYSSTPKLVKAEKYYNLVTENIDTKHANQCDAI